MRFIYFDLGNVLVRFDHHVACEKMAAVANLNKSDVWRVVYESDLAFRYERGEITSREFHSAFCQATSTQPRFADLYHASADMFDPCPQMTKLVQHLHLAGHSLGILSNTCESHWDYCLAHYPWLSRCFARHALSFRIQSLKPEPRIYRVAAEMAKAAPREIFFTDDRPENVAAAREAGFDAVPFHSPSQLESELASRGAFDPHNHFVRNQNPSA